MSRRQVQLVQRETRGCSLNDLKRELMTLERYLAQLERADRYKQRIDSPTVNALAGLKADYRRRIARLKHRLDHQS